MTIQIGSYEAKTRLSELLREVQAGQRYTITLRGEPIAELVPPTGGTAGDAAAAAAQMRELMLGAAPIKGLDLKALIDDGRA